MKINLFAPKLVSRVQYLTKSELNKKYDCKGLPSVTRVIANSNRAQKTWVETQMRDKNSAMYKATVQGRKAHSALETGTINDDLTQAVVDCFTSDILVDIDEVWGQEQWLYHPDRYTGKFDGCGVYKGKVTLFDYKKTNKRKTPKQLSGYFTQLVAYKKAHEFLYSTEIEQLAIFNVFGTDPSGIGATPLILTPDEVTVAASKFTEMLDRVK